MTITSYAELQASIADTLDRDNLTAAIPTFITLAESSMNRRLRHWRMEKRATSTLTGKYSDVPSDWLESIRFDIVGETKLELIAHAKMMDLREQNNTMGIPCFYSMVAGEFELYPTPSESIDTQLLYYSRLTALSDTETSNWLLTVAPDAYLYGALLHAAPYLQDDERIVVWGGFYKDIIDGLNEESEKAKYSGSPLIRR